MRWTCILTVVALLGSRVLATPTPTRSPVTALGPNIDQFAVKNLPQINFAIPKSWAGEISTGAGFGNNSLFFWLWEADCDNGKGDLIVWFQGGPACSSLLGLFKEHGPIWFPGGSTKPQSNPNSWTKVANVLYVDQPVGTGFSFGSPEATSNAGNVAAFVQWLEAFFKVFPALRTKRVHLMGESFAGVFLPYIAQAIQAQKHILGFEITSVGLGSAAWGNGAAQTSVVATTFINKHSNSYGTKIPSDVLAVLLQADNDCGFSPVLSQITYPATGKITIPGNPENDNYKIKARHDTYKRNYEAHSHIFVPRSAQLGYNPSICDFDNGTHTAADLAFLINGTSPENCYGSCATYDGAFNYFADANGVCFNAYNIEVDCSNQLYSDNAYQAYLNLPEVKAAIHVPHFINFTTCNNALSFDLSGRDKRVAPPAYSVIPSLLAQGVEVNLWAGTLDYIIIPLGQELSIQNMTWNGSQGFKKKPNTKFYDNKGKYAGTYGAERGLSYYLFEGAGHRVPQDKPAASLRFVQDRVVKRKGKGVLEI